MFTVAVKDHIMIAHSFRGRLFGPAQRLHGATFVISTEYQREQLDQDGVVIDIGKAHEVLALALEPLKFRNLDEIEEFKDQNTTTEFLARYIHEQVAARVRPFFAGGLRVVLEESHVAWGSYQAEV